MTSKLMTSLSDEEVKELDRFLLSDAVSEDTMLDGYLMGLTFDNIELSNARN